MISKQALIRNSIKFLILLCIVLSSTSELSGQIKGIIIEKDSKLPIPFASIIYQKQSQQQGVISDIHGKFEINESDIQSFTVTCMGYKQNQVLTSALSKPENAIVELEILIHELDEVRVTPGNNPAIRIIKKVLENKDQNNFQNYENYNYRCYVKTLIDLKLANDANARDSSLINNNQGLKKHAALISEYIVSCFNSDNLKEYKIVAQKTSGFESPMFVQALTSVFHNTISFYNNSISLFEMPVSSDLSLSEYISPLSDGCLKTYSFKLQDTIVNSTDSVFIIDFHPKKGKNFNGLKGKLYVSTNRFAIKNIVVEPVEKGLIGFKFRQDYEFINNKWFPSSLDEEIGWVNQKIGGDMNAYPVYLITSVIDSVSYNPASIRNKYPEKVYVDLKSIEKSDSLINAIRPEKLTERENNTFHFLDSVGQKHNFEYWLQLFPKLASGKLPVHFIDIDLYRVYASNKFEGSRLGIGLNTNEKLSRFLSLGGFVAYGFKDEQYKYGAKVVLDLNMSADVQMKLSYQNNLKETGFDLIDDYSQLPFSAYLRSNIGYRFDNCIEKKAEFSFRTLRFLKVSGTLSLKDIQPTYTYLYKGAPLLNYQSDEMQVNLNYAYGFDRASMNNQQIVNYYGNPIINISYRRGLDLFSEQSFQYNRIESTVDFTAYNGRVGQSSFRLAAGFIDRSLPYGLLFTGEGSKNSNMSLFINNSFQTMAPYEFLSDKYVNLFYSHNFASLLFSTRKFKPQLILVQNSGWGALNNAAHHGIDFKEKDKIYLESGLIFNNILRFNYLKLFYVGFGAGAFYRYGYYGFANYKDNIALKLSLTISLK